MKRYMIVIVILSALLIPTIAQAEAVRQGAYVAWFLGVTSPLKRSVDTIDIYSNQYHDRVEFDPGINVGGSGGYDFGYVRLEGEISYKNAGVSSVYDTGSGTTYSHMHGSLGVFAAMANCFFDLHNGSPVTPYLGGGIGVATLYFGDITGVSGGTRYHLYDSDSDSVFAYQVGAGVEIAINRRFSLDLGYRYFATEKARFESWYQESRMSYASHNGTIGLRFSF